MTTRQEVIEVAGGEPVTITVRETVDGPVISDVADIDTYTAVGASAPVPAPGSRASREVPPPRGDGYAVALRWTALQPSTMFDAVDVLNTAQDWEEFRAGAALFGAPAQNLIYADLEGNIGYQAPGVIPIREGYDGKWPIPGWDSRYQWKGTIPFTALPSVLNPSEGWIVTANQAVIGPGLPVLHHRRLVLRCAQPAHRRPDRGGDRRRRQHRRQPDAVDPDGLGHASWPCSSRPGSPRCRPRTPRPTPSACSTGGTSPRAPTRHRRRTSTRCGGRWSPGCSTERPTPSSSTPAAATATGRSWRTSGTPRTTSGGTTRRSTACRRGTRPCRRPWRPRSTS